MVTCHVLDMETNAAIMETHWWETGQFQISRLLNETMLLTLKYKTHYKNESKTNSSELDILLTGGFFKMYKLLVADV